MGGGIFCTSHGFVKGCFTILLHSLQALEVELCCAIYDIELTEQFNWKDICLESF